MMMCVFQKSAHDMDVNCVQFHPKENLLATAGDDSVIKLWSINDENF